MEETGDEGTVVGEGPDADAGMEESDDEGTVVGEGSAIEELFKFND